MGWSENERWAEGMQFLGMQFLGMQFLGMQWACNFWACSGLACGSRARAVGVHGCARAADVSEHLNGGQPAAVHHIRSCAR